MKNILNDKEREGVGLDTQLRFDYQANWAITYLLEKVLKNEDFVIFMEYHEDVISSNSSKFTENIEFEFYQLKTTLTNFTLENMCKFETTSNSVLGKMILSVEGKTFKKNVKKLCLLSVSNINFEKKISIMGESRFLYELQESEISKILDSLGTELKEVDIGYKEIICFKKSNLPFQTSESTVKGKIAEFIEKKYGSVQSNVANIHTALWDDLRIKYDFLIPYDRWDECVENRGLKSDQVTAILTRNIQTKIDSNLSSFIEKYLNKYTEEDIFTPIKINIINDYHTYLITNRSSSTFHQVKALRAKIIPPSNIFDANTYANSIDVLENIINSDATLKVFNQMKAVSTYEILRLVYEKLTAHK